MEEESGKEKEREGEVEDAAAFEQGCLLTADVNHANLGIHEI